MAPTEGGGGVPVGAAVGRKEAFAGQLYAFEQARAPAGRQGQNCSGSVIGESSVSFLFGLRGSRAMIALVTAIRLSSSRSAMEGSVGLSWCELVGYIKAGNDCKPREISSSMFRLFRVPFFINAFSVPAFRCCLPRQCAARTGERALARCRSVVVVSRARTAQAMTRVAWRPRTAHRPAERALASQAWPRRCRRRKLG